MANLAATREALERFSNDLPSAGLHADRLRRTAEAARASIDGAMADPDGRSPWADHNLSVVVAEALAETSTRAAGLTLFLGVRRRLAGALERDGDDLAAALALAAGAARAVDDPRIAADIGLVAGAIGRPAAGPRFVAAAVRLVAAASGAKGAETRGAAAAAAVPVRKAADAMRGRLPFHPDLGLDLARLDLAAARRAEGEERAVTLDRVHGLLTDHEQRFGTTARGRSLRGELLEVRARGGAAAQDIRRDAVKLFDAGLADRSLGPKSARRLVRAMERAGGLDTDTASRLVEQIESYAGQDRTAWRDVMGSLLEHSGDQAALVSLWERAILDDANDGEAADGLAERLVRNLRSGLPAPFESEVLDRILGAVRPKAVARWSAHDVAQLSDTISETFGVSRAATFLRDRVLSTRKLRSRTELWDRALALFGELDDDAALMDVAREAIRQSGAASARFLLVDRLLASGKNLDEAEITLRPLLGAKGDLGARAHALSQKLRRHPALRGAQRDAMLSFEHRIGIGTDRAFKLQVVYASPSYVLAEAVEATAPEFYEHRHIRTMLKNEDLPKGVTVHDLRKGDKLRAPISAQDATRDRDREGIRVYWIADREKVELVTDAQAIAKRWDQEERDFGIGSGGLIPVQLRWDPKKKSLQARILRKSGGGEFGIRPRVNDDQLPAGLDKERLGKKGKRTWGLVVRSAGDGATAGKRRYGVEGQLTLEAPVAADRADTTPAKATEAAAAPTAEASGGAAAAEVPVEAPVAEAPAPAPVDAAAADPAATAPETSSEASAPAAEAPVEAAAAAPEAAEEAPAAPEGQVEADAPAADGGDDAKESSA